MDTDKYELKSSMFICVYTWFIEDIWNRYLVEDDFKLLNDVLLVPVGPMNHHI